MNTRALLSSNRFDWCTPQDFYNELDAEFHFTIDAAATEKSAKCTRYYTPETDGLSASWAGETVFCNPPYGREIKAWVKKGYEEGQHPGTTVVLLIPSRTDTTYFHDYIINKAEIRFLKGRLKFTNEEGEPQNAAPFPSLLAIYRGSTQKPESSFKCSNKELILALIRERDMTANEITERLQADGYDIDRGTVSPCLTKLQADRLVENIGKRPCKVTCKNAIAWKAR